MKKHPDTIRLFLAIGAGGALGACTRYAVSLLFTGSFFPYGTLIVNLAGCFLLTYITSTYAGVQRLSSLLLTAVSVGFIGSFTTLSAFALETIRLLEENGWFAFVYIFISLFGGLLFCWLGYQVGRKRT